MLDTFCPQSLFGPRIPRAWAVRVCQGKLRKPSRPKHLPASSISFCAARRIPAPIAPLTSSQQQRMHQIPPQNPGSRGGERLTYLLACSGRSPAGTSTTANKSELPQKFQIPNPKLPKPSTINLVSKNK